MVSCSLAMPLLPTALALRAGEGSVSPLQQERGLSGMVSQQQTGTAAYQHYRMHYRGSYKEAGQGEPFIQW